MLPPVWKRAPAAGVVDGAGLVMVAEGGGDREPEPEEWGSPAEG